MRRAACFPIAVLALVVLVGCGSSSRSAVTAPTTTFGASSTSVTAAAPSGATSTSTSTSTSVPVSSAPEINPSGDIPDNQVFVRYAEGAAFSLEVPEGWARTKNGIVTTFSDHYNQIRISSTRRAAARNVTTARALDVPALARTESGFVLDRVTMTTRAAGDTVLVQYRTQSAADPVTGKRVTLAVERYEFWRHGTAVVLRLSAPVGSDNVDPWKRVTDSFAWSG